MLQLGSDILASNTASLVSILGVTPEVVQLPWPARARLLAFDQSAEMIKSVWLPHKEVYSEVTQACWQHLPLTEASVDLAVGDGCLTALQGRAEIDAVMMEVARILKPAGKLIMRCFVRPEKQESVASVVAQARTGHIQCFGTLKWRLAMALCHAGSSTVHPPTIHQVFCEEFPDRHQLANSNGWELDTIDTINSYENMDGLFTFPQLSEIYQLCAPWFTVSAIKHGSYELAERCPTLLFSRRQ